MNDDVLDALEAELGHPALFDEGVEASRNACAAGASIAAAAITASAYYDNPLTGLGALRALMGRLRELPVDLAAWRAVLVPAPHPETGDADFVPGFGFVTREQAQRVREVCRRIAPRLPPMRSRCRWLAEHQDQLEFATGPLNGMGLAAVVYLDRELDLEQAERRWLLCKVAIAVAEAQQARRAGLAAFPFSGIRYEYSGPRPSAAVMDWAQLLARVGLENVDG